MSEDMDLGGCAAYAFVVVIVLFLAASLCGSLVNMIDHDEARARFAEMEGVDVSDVIIIRHSNSTPIIGHPHDVTYELRINGKSLSGRCTSGDFSPMVCRIYESGGE